MLFIVINIIKFVNLFQQIYHFFLVLVFVDYLEDFLPPELLLVGLLFLPLAGERDLLLLAGEGDLEDKLPTDILAGPFFLAGDGIVAGN